MSWTKYWIKACEGNNDHVCPFCGMPSAHHKVNLRNNGQRGYIEFWCDACGKRDVATFVKTSDNYPEFA